MQKDPIGLDGGVNVYLYGEANPLYFYDSTGKHPVTAIVVIIAGDLRLAVNKIRQCMGSSKCRCEVIHSAYKKACSVSCRAQIVRLLQCKLGSR